MTSLDKIAGPLAAKLIRQFGTNVTYTAMSDSCPPVETVFTLKGIIEYFNKFAYIYVGMVSVNPPAGLWLRCHVSR